MNRINIHYYLYARKKKLPIYHSNNDKHLCRNYLKKYAYVFLEDFSSMPSEVPRFSPPIQMRKLISQQTKKLFSVRHRRWVASR